MAQTPNSQQKILHRVSIAFCSCVRASKWLIRSRSVQRRLMPRLGAFVSALDFDFDVNDDVDDVDVFVRLARA